ncbi:gluconokinase [Natronospirillum operosum]|uniref:Gluconokinase n=1 Tax=Natronospirillum operosum TaxID=2759953 RepID=A0A4Z0WA17_9GAMM|nr:gluconokinase [Natronospirillum operosum]TGG93195.1 gluconokinase [Natronospirillum operosum]
MSTQKIIVMGVSGSGKSLIGARLGRELQLPFYDADDFHTADNIRKMSDGIPLSDQDRAGWLQQLAALLQAEPGLVLACSALKADYRRRLQEASPEVTFLYLCGDFDTIWARLARREDHYFSGHSMLRSQFDQLEEPDHHEAIRISIDQPADSVLEECLRKINNR